MNNSTFPNPQLLLHPNVPKPLHGLNPRTLLGQKWWDEQREIAYAQHDYHCHACGVHKRQAKYHRWLEAHEIYRYDYAIGSAEMIAIVALCHSCHNFIHDGRMQELIKAGDMQFKVQKYLDILEHGNSIIEGFLADCRGWNVGERWKYPFKATQPFQRVFPFVQVSGLEAISEATANWSDWHLIVEGQRFYTQFESLADWKAFYAKENAKTSVTHAFQWNKDKS